MIKQTLLSLVLSPNNNILRSTFQIKFQD